jgi:hypothetical protein
VLVVIGPRWLETVKKRLQSHDDFVRHEVGAALRRRINVIPVLVGRAGMPKAGDLPEELAELSLRNAVEIRDERFDDDVAALENALSSELHLAESPQAGTRARVFSRRRVAIALVVAACASAGYFLLRPGSRVAAEPTAPVIDGDWVAEMQKPGQPPFRIRVRFDRIGDSLGGMVQYPTGDGPMHDVTLKGRTLTFSTTHLPQFASSPVTIHFQAEVAADSIRLMASYDSGVATGVAARPPPR